MRSASATCGSGCAAIQHPLVARLDSGNQIARDVVLDPILERLHVDMLPKQLDPLHAVAEFDLVDKAVFLVFAAVASPCTLLPDGFDTSHEALPPDERPLLHRKEIRSEEHTSELQSHV